MTARSDNRCFAALLLVAAALLLAGCASSSVGTQSGGSDFRNSYDYLPVNDQPPGREQPLMSAEEQAKLRESLTAARDHQTSRTTKPVTNAAKPVSNATKPVSNAAKPVSNNGTVKQVTQ